MNPLGIETPTRAITWMAHLAPWRGVRIGAGLPVAIVFAAAVCGVPAQAAEFSVTPSVGLQSDYDDNLQMTSLPHDSIWSYDLSPRVSLSRRTEISEVRLDGRVDVRRYLGHSSFDTNDLALNLSSHYYTELNRWALGASAVRDTVLTGELEASGVLSGKRIRRNSLGFNPSWTRQVDAQTSLQLAYNLNDVSYPGSSSYTDYRYQEVDGSLIRQWDAKTQSTVTVLGSRFDVPASKSSSDTLGVQVGVTRNFSETSRGSLTAGWRSTKASGLVTEVVPIPFPPYYTLYTHSQSTKSNGVLLSASWEQKFEQGVARASISRSLSPGGLGVLYQADQVKLHASRNISPKSYLTLDAVALRNRSAQGGSAGSDRRYFSVSPGLHWRLTRWWLLTASYRYRWQKYDNSTVSASANSVSLSIEYTWPKWSISR